jgi:hypothetical protein
VIESVFGQNGSNWKSFSSKRTLKSHFRDLRAGHEIVPHAPHPKYQKFHFFFLLEMPVSHYSLYFSFLFLWASLSLSLLSLISVTLSLLQTPPATALPRPLVCPLSQSLSLALSLSLSLYFGNPTVFYFFFISLFYIVVWWWVVHFLLFFICADSWIGFWKSSLGSAWISVNGIFLIKLCLFVSFLPLVAIPTLNTVITRLWDVFMQFYYSWVNLLLRLLLFCLLACWGLASALHNCFRCLCVLVRVVKNC